MTVTIGPSLRTAVSIAARQSVAIGGTPNTSQTCADPHLTQLGSGVGIAAAQTKSICAEEQSPSATKSGDVL
ncbi:MAG TPA: hypothetical protein VNZ26_35665, partial [Vicinamibacterales bacterium]|nr:hypothetical protein [Vicinamibacterales bacterium]